MRVSPPPGRLVSFTLADVPLEIRRRGVAGARTTHETEDHRPEDRLFAHLLAGADDPLREAAEKPSNKRYWITERAWSAIMG